MKTKIPAKDVLDKAEKWFVWLDGWVEEEYKLHVEDAMKRTWSNLWLGRSEKFAAWWLDNIHTGGLWENYKDRVRKHYWWTSSRAKTAKKMAEVAIKSGQEYVWVDEDDLIYLNRYNTHQKLNRKRLTEDETKVS